MRKACIELNHTLKNAALFAGDLGGGKCLYFKRLSDENLEREPSQDEWRDALEECQRKAADLRYEVTRIRGKSLAGI